MNLLRVVRRFLCFYYRHAFGPRVATRTGITLFRVAGPNGIRPELDRVAEGRPGWKRTCRWCGYVEHDPVRIVVRRPRS